MYSPSSFFKPVLMKNTKEDILKNASNRTVYEPPLTSIVGKNYHGSQWGPSTVWLLTFFKISSLVFFIYAGLKQLKAELKFLSEPFL